MATGIRFTLEYVQNWFIERDCKLLTNVYENKRHKLRYECHCGEIHERTFGHVRQYGTCKNGNIGAPRMSDDEIRKRFEESGKTFIEEVGRRKGQHRRFKCVCGCGNVLIIEIGQLSATGCTKCSSESRKMPFCDVKDAFESLNLILLSSEDEYLNSSSKLRCKCKQCGEMHETTYNSVQSGHIPCCCSRVKRGSKIRGENHPHWNPNLSQEDRENGRKYTEYREWRKSVYERDNYTCQCCGARRNLNAHHLYNYADFYDLRTVLENGATTCVTCHRQFHDIYGRRNTTPEQFYEYKRWRQQQLGIYDVNDVEKEVTESGECMVENVRETTEYAVVN